MTMTQTSTSAAYYAPYTDASPRRGRPTTDAFEGLVESAVCRRLVRELIRAKHRDRPEALVKVVEHLRSARPTAPALDELLYECAVMGGPDGLDLAIDVLSEVGVEAVRYARELLNRDGPTWKIDDDRHLVTNDTWYALLRGVCRSQIDPFEKIILLHSAAMSGPVGIREAAVHAAGDLASTNSEFSAFAKAVLGQLAKQDKSETVRASATEVLADMEG
jgi:hypothetical protein